jgi:hypothetical protein
MSALHFFLRGVGVASSLVLTHIYRFILSLLATNT